MIKSTIERDELIARTDNSHRIGIDTCGLAHYYDPLLNVAWTTTVFGNITHTAHVEDLGVWVDFVATDRGWADCAYTTDSLGDQLAAALAEAV